MAPELTRYGELRDPPELFRLFVAPQLAQPSARWRICMTQRGVTVAFAYWPTLLTPFFRQDGRVAHAILQPNRPLPYYYHVTYQKFRVWLLPGRKRDYCSGKTKTQEPPWMSRSMLCGKMKQTNHQNNLNRRPRKGLNVCSKEKPPALKLGRPNAWSDNYFFVSFSFLQEKTSQRQNTGPRMRKE